MLCYILHCVRLSLYLLLLVLLLFNRDFGYDFPFYQILVHFFQISRNAFFVIGRLSPIPPSHDYQKYIPVNCTLRLPSPAIVRHAAEPKTGVHITINLCTPFYN